MAVEKRVSLVVRVPESVSRQIDTVRGSMSRSAWVSTVIHEALAGAGGEVSPRAGKKVIHTDGERCPHPKARVLKGFCYRCGKSVL